jgi:SAM-dependent methyltransferase
VTAPPSTGSVERQPSLRLSLPGLSGLELTFVEDGGATFVIPTRTGTAWSVAALKAGECRVQLPGRQATLCSARLVTDRDQADRVRSLFRAKYGDTHFERYFAQSLKVVALWPGVPASPRQYLDQVREEFDAVAPAYSRSIESNPFARELRRRSTAEILAKMAHADPLLEIGSGTGAETLPLLAAGHHVLAVDISAGMLRELSTRAASAGTSDRLTTRLGPASDLEALLRDLPDGYFGGGYSTFGALNLEPTLAPLAAPLGRLLRPGSPLVAGVLNREAVVPLVYAFASGHPRQAIQRLSIQVPAGREFALDVYPTTVRAIARTFARDFELAACMAASVLAPPDDAPRLRRWLGPGGLRLARAMDERLRRRRVFARWSEWLLVTLRRRAPSL